jgi:molybdopterin synthase catalytic subunit
MKISVQQEDFDLGLEVLDIQQDNRIGAVASFVGQVREVPMTLEHYPGMTENAIKKIVEEARSQWQVMDYTVIHRYGDLQTTRSCWWRWRAAIAAMPSPPASSSWTT